MIWFTSDQHFSHRNIIGYTGRPHCSVHIMNKDIISKYNQVVAEDDEVWFLGDLTLNKDPDYLYKFIYRLSGTKHLVLGNHDKIRNIFTYHEIGFSSVHTALEKEFILEDGTKEKFYLAHDPAWAQIPNTNWICGHVHQHWDAITVKPNINIINVGVDVNDFYPISLKDVVEKLNNLRGW